jgi:threonyl-tRNA synthetase
LKKHKRKQVMTVITPHWSRRTICYLWPLCKYGTNGFQLITTHEGEEFYWKPMNCPHHYWNIQRATLVITRL